MATERGLAGLAFADAGEEEKTLAEMKGRWRKATYIADAARTAPIAQRIFDPTHWQAEQPLRIVLIGTDWEVRVWEALLKIPMGRVATYSGIAGKVCTPAAVPRRRRRGRQKPDRLRRALPPRHRQGRRADRLSLGPDAEARHARLGGRPSRRGVEVITRTRFSFVTPGLDPGVHAESPHARHGPMDCRVKPGNDEENHAARSRFSATVESALSR